MVAVGTVGVPVSAGLTLATTTPPVPVWEVKAVPPFIERESPVTAPTELTVNGATVLDDGFTQRSMPVLQVNPALDAVGVLEMATGPFVPVIVSKSSIGIASEKGSRNPYPVPAPSVFQPVYIEFPELAAVPTMDRIFWPLAIEGANMLWAITEAVADETICPALGLMIEVEGFVIAAVELILVSETPVATDGIKIALCVPVTCQLSIVNPVKAVIPVTCIATERGAA